MLLEEVTKISVTAAVTDAGISADKQRLGLVTTEGVYLYFINANPASIQTAEREFTRFPNDFMEGGTFVDGGFLASAETRELWLFTNANFLCTSPPNFTLVPADRSVQLGSNIELEAEVEGCPKPAFKWTFNGGAARQRHERHAVGSFPAPATPSTSKRPRRSWPCSGPGSPPTCPGRSGSQPTVCFLSVPGARATLRHSAAATPTATPS